MGYYISFASEANADPVDGDDVASTAGWDAFGAWATGLSHVYQELAYLGWHGECHPAEAVAALEKEIDQATTEKPGKPSTNVLHVLQRLGAAVKARPADCSGFVITDGTEGRDEDD